MAYDDDDDYVPSADDSASHSHSKRKKSHEDEPDESKMTETHTLKKRGYSTQEQSMIEEWLKKNKIQEMK
jgi:hypothetical protein